MKAVLVTRPGGPEALTIGEVPEPVLRAGEVLVHVKAAGVNRADLLQAAGRYPPPLGESSLLGLEIAGEVDGTGERVCALLPGGGYAEKAAVPREMLMPIPDRMTFVDAAAIPEAYFTAFLNLFLEGELKAGERALVYAAASGVGTAAIQLAHRAGATVIGVTRTPEKCDAVRLLGADLAVFTAEGDLAARVEAAFGGNAIHVILDSVGGGSLSASVRVLAPQGRLVLIATMGGGTAEIDLRAVLRKRLRIVGSTLRSRPLREKIELTRVFARDVLPGFVDGTLRPVIDSVFPLELAADAHRRMASNKNVGKIVLRMD